jgi:hypothetical protein
MDGKEGDLHQAERVEKESHMPLKFEMNLAD